jgi:hypothetical protein
VSGTARITPTQLLLRSTARYRSSGNGPRSQKKWKPCTAPITTCTGTTGRAHFKPRSIEVQDRTLFNAERVPAFTHHGSRGSEDTEASGTGYPAGPTPRTAIEILDGCPFVYPVWQPAAFSAPVQLHWLSPHHHAPPPYLGHPIHGVAD